MIVVDKKSFKMAIDETKHILSVQVLGLLREADTEEYLQDLQETINKVSRSNYTFMVDATYQTPLPSKVAAGLDNIMLFYSSFGFKDIIIVKPKSKIAQVQIRNALERIEFNGTFIDSK
ncbi:hypothetical protein LZ480_05590 [Solibacillus sp. MA9]|uniref:Uncharacterized protein n=1 Tax=Solibacillus palustris TaxID=2908203 RepID=A0ABS9UB66_9BACL|nr:hypothetical protein [Solibacillus sp. MA9]MCH7321360.1 hypothetical protein [Solibacillus sp. MA9]